MGSTTLYSKNSTAVLRCGKGVTNPYRFTHFQCPETMTDAEREGPKSNPVPMHPRSPTVAKRAEAVWCWCFARKRNEVVWSTVLLALHRGCTTTISHAPPVQSKEDGARKIHNEVVGLHMHSLCICTCTTILRPSLLASHQRSLVPFGG